LRKLEFAPEAEADLLEIAAYITRDDPARAARFIDELEALCRAAALPRHRPRAPRTGPGTSAPSRTGAT